MEQIARVTRTSRGSTSGTSTPEGCVNVEETRTCPHCGREIAEKWVPFPPALREKYGRDGQVWFPPCSTECERAEELAEWEGEVRRRRVEGLRGKSEIPERLSRSTLETFDPGFSEAAARGLAAVERYLGGWEANREAGRGLYLCGGYGSGKTHLAAGAAQRLISRGVPTFFHTVPELLDRLRPSAGSASDDREAWMSAAMDAELLVLDDLGAENPTEWANERIFVIVNHRYRRDLPTIYTSNVRPNGLVARVGERTRSRIIETSGFVLMDGPDHRVEARRST